MKTTATVLMSMVLMSSIMNAQDIITTKSGEEVKAKVIEVTPTEVKFKKFENLDGPVYAKGKSEIFMIKYEGGAKDVFNAQLPSTPAPASKTALDNAYFPTPTDPATIKPKNPEMVSEKPDDEDEILPQARRYGGPRAGITYVTPGLFTDALNAEGKRNYYSQFGWQFEKRLFTTKTGITPVLEIIPMIGGIDMGKFIPSLTGIIGLRIKNGMEVGVGPMAALYTAKDIQGNFNTTGSVGIVIAAGFSLKSDKVYFPINIAFTPSIGKRVANGIDSKTGQTQTKTVETGAKISLIVGFNYRKH